MNEIDQNTIELIRERIHKKNPEAEIILFGSRAREQENLNSDRDILILLNIPYVNRKIEKEYREKIFEVELETGEPISTLVFSKQDWIDRHSFTPLFENIQRDGIYL
ncbi:MAG TPA: nucleotidyltransferase domain-containing protein [Salinimicrobium sp.]|nr:nucleotidyltransferase domain-containing protein [Salinimicrobium sp.]